MAAKFHLGWFTSFTTDPWADTFANGGNSWNGRFFVDFARMFERACFDFILLEDKLAIPETYGGTSEIYLAQAQGFAPKNDPARLPRCWPAQPRAWASSPPCRPFRRRRGRAASAASAPSGSRRA